MNRRAAQDRSAAPERMIAVLVRARVRGVGRPGHVEDERSVRSEAEGARPGAAVASLLLHGSRPARHPRPADRLRAARSASSPPRGSPGCRTTSSRAGRRELDGRADDDDGVAERNALERLVAARDAHVDVEVAPRRLAALSAVAPTTTRNAPVRARALRRAGRPASPRSSCRACAATADRRRRRGRPSRRPRRSGRRSRAAGRPPCPARARSSSRARRRSPLRMRTPRGGRSRPPLPRTRQAPNGAKQLVEQRRNHAATLPARHRLRWLTPMMLSAAAIDARGVRRRGQVYVALAALAWSSAGVLQRELSVGTATQVAGRAVFAALALLAFVAVSERRRRRPALHVDGPGRARGRDPARRSRRGRSSSRSTTRPSRTSSSCRRWRRSPRR